MSNRRTRAPERTIHAVQAAAASWLPICSILFCSTVIGPLMICSVAIEPNPAYAQVRENAAPADPSDVSQESSRGESSQNEDLQAAAADEELPTLEEMDIPTTEQLLREPPMDWIVLKYKQQVIVAEPVTPRPDTLQQMQTALDEKQKQRTRMSGDALAKFREELDALSKLKLRLPNQTDEADYLLRMNLVEQIIHHEDLVLRRVNVLIDEEQFDLAYELLNILRRKTPDWPGAVDRHNALLWAEAGRKIARNQYESALATLTELHSRSPQFPGLAERTGETADRLIERAVAAEDWRGARYFLRRLDDLYFDHATAQSWRSRLLELAEQQLAEAAQVRSAGDHRRALMHAERAAAIWPSTPDLRARYRVFANRYQVLHVGVLDLPSAQAGTPLSFSYAAERAQRLREVRFFEVDHADDGSAHYSTPYCDWWELLNLGRAARFELRSSRQSWEMQPVVTAPVIAGRIAARLDPAHPAYDERLSGYARSVEVHSPYSFTVHFERVPVRIEPLLSIPVIEHDHVMDQNSVIEQDAGDEATSFADAPSARHKSSTVSFTGAPAPAGGFQRAELTPELAVYRRALPEPDGVAQYHLAEIQERCYADADTALQGLLRGEVSMLVRPPAWFVDLLAADEQMLKSFFVARMAVPVTHVVQFHPHSEPLKNREYRRALAYGIDRRQILTETVLRSRASRLGRVVNGPFPSRSDAVNALVETREYDPVAAVSLALAARKQLGGDLPPLSMVVVNDPVAREAAERLVEAWSRIGIEVQIRELPAGPLVGDGETEPEWDLIYRTVQLTEPSVQLWPFLALRERARVSDLDPFPDWLRQEIIDLDLVTDWRDAVQSVNRLHLRLWGDVLLLPLWEVDEYLIYRKNVRGVPVRPVHPYEDVDRWIVESWYSEPLP